MLVPSALVSTPQTLHTKLQMGSVGSMQISSLLWSLGRCAGSFSLRQVGSGRAVLLQLLLQTPAAPARNWPFRSTLQSHPLHPAAPRLPRQIADAFNHRSFRASLFQVVYKPPQPRSPAPSAWDSDLGVSADNSGA